MSLKTGATSGCFDLIQRFIFPVLNEWVAGYWTSVIAGQPVVKTLSSVLEMDALQQSVKTGVGVLAQYASTVRSGLAVCVALSFKKVKKGVRIFVPPSLSLIVENLTLRVFGIMISENLGSIS